jgi:outer membrane protein assembly factor BamB
MLRVKGPNSRPKREQKATRRGKDSAGIAIGDVKLLFAILWLFVAVFFNAVVPTYAQVNVTQFHNHESRDGLYIDSAFTQSAAVNLRRDLNFDGTIAGNVYAQPLYIEGGPMGKAMIIVATESNNVYALDAGNGTIIWQRNVGEPVSADDLICTKLDPVGTLERLDTLQTKLSKFATEMGPAALAAFGYTNKTDFVQKKLYVLRSYP